MECERTVLPPADESRVVIISHEIVGSRMAGPGIRYYHLARVLSQYFPVTLAVPTGSRLEIPPGLIVLVYRSGQDALLEKAIREARAILIPAIWVTSIPFLLESTVPLVIDGYDPFLAETLNLGGETNSQQVTLTQAYLAGDFFICASERQRDWWLGLLEANGRINRYTYGEDASLRHLVDQVPFGLPQEPPQHTHDTVKGVWPGIGKADQIILWGGGLWSWLDPLTAIRAIARIWQDRQDIRLIFPGTRHPNPGMVELSTQERAARDLARELGLLGRAVFFGDWIAYADWQNVLLESDVALTLHGSDTLETRLAFRSRVLDYIWASLPIVATRGDATSDLIAEHDLGVVVDCLDVESVANAILRLLDLPRDSFAARFENVRQSLTWEWVARPLIEFCRHPRRAADKVALGQPMFNPFLNEINKLHADIARLNDLVRAYEQRRIVRMLDYIQRLTRRGK